MSLIVVTPMLWPPDRLGYGASAHHTMYGIWEPVLDRFLFVADRVDLLQDLVLLNCARFRCFVIEILTARTHANILDNTVCLNWTVSPQTRGSVNLTGDQWSVIQDQGLVELGAQTAWPMAQEHEFFQRAYHILDCVTNIEFHLSPQQVSSSQIQILSAMPMYQLLDDLQPQLLQDSQLWQQYKTTKRQGRLSIFESQNSAQLENAWQQVLDRHALWDQWHQWIAGRNP